MVNNEARNLIERLRFVQGCLPQARLGGPVKEAADLLEQQSERLAKLEERLATIYSQPVELPEAVGRTMHYIGNDAYARKHSYCARTYEEMPKGMYSDTWEDLEQIYTADQLTQAVQEATARALEAAARECDARYMGDNNREDMEARRCAAAIRNLIGRVK